MKLSAVSSSWAIQSGGAAISGTSRAARSSTPCCHSCRRFSAAPKSGDNSGSRLPTNADPLAGHQIEADFGDLEVIIAIRKAASTLDRQIEILDPLAGCGDDAAAGAKV